MNRSSMLTLRMPRDLHAWLRREAKRRRVSVADVVRGLVLDAMEARR